jgi:hypothetical protein
MLRHRKISVVSGAKPVALIVELICDPHRRRRRSRVMIELSS